MIISLYGLLIRFRLKEVIAYSTISHLSLIFFLLNLKFFRVVFIYMVFHALFKSLIFISSGYLIGLIFGDQDLRLISNVYNYSLLVIIFFYISLFVLIGFPYISIFYLKDLILELIWTVKLNYLIIIIFGFKIFFLRIVYSIKLIIYLMSLGGEVLVLGGRSNKIIFYFIVLFSLVSYLRCLFIRFFIYCVEFF